PELNPAERLWDELREKEFANKLFDCLDAVIAQLALGLWRMEDSPEALQSLTGWKYILSAS
ncbi:MAG: IS630 family transposase, partial [Desulfofustis sp. PB-SRB1]|nr:IS630 family transposase [Desulfofustis sp. PB-SRB1]